MLVPKLAALIAAGPLAYLVLPAQYASFVFYPFWRQSLVVALLVWRSQALELLLGTKKLGRTILGWTALSMLLNVPRFAPSLLTVGAALQICSARCVPSTYIVKFGEHIRLNPRALLALPVVVAISGSRDITDLAAGLVLGMATPL